MKMLMGHARHGIHSMWRDDSFLLSLQGEPDVYVNPEDANSKGVEDGELIECSANQIIYCSSTCNICDGA